MFHHIFFIFPADVQSKTKEKEKGKNLQTQ